MDELPGTHVQYLSLYLGFDHVIGSVAVDGSGLNNDARLTRGNFNIHNINVGREKPDALFPFVVFSKRDL